MAEPSKKDTDRNVRLQRFYPIGMVNAIWSIVDTLWGTTNSEKEKELLEGVLKALAKYDDHVRKTHHKND